MDQAPTEVWKPVVGFEEAYLVSNLGRVKSRPRILGLRVGCSTFYSGKIIGSRLDRYGYFKVQLSFKGESVTRTIHRLVAQAFIENPKHLPVVNHLNGDKKDNRMENLAWCTNQENVLHYHRSSRSHVHLNKERRANEAPMLPKTQSAAPEEWRPTEYPNCEVSSKGRVRVAEEGGYRELKQINQSHRHQKVWMPLGKGARLMPIHRLVAKAFIPNPKNLPDVFHADLDVRNNIVENLSWVSEREGRRKRQQKAPKNLGENSVLSKLKNEDVWDIRALVSFGASRRALAEAFGVNLATIRQIVLGRRWKHI